MDDVKTTLLFTLSAEVDKPLDLRNANGTGRFIIPATGGVFNGPRLRGTVVPVGADWLTVKEGYGKIDVRALLKTDDGELIYVTYQGVHTISAEIRDRIAAGEDVDSSEYYFRVAPMFETSAPKYDWLNRIVAVGIGARTQTTVDYQVFEIL